MSAGPWCAALLADLGAEVIRVERPGGGDDRYIAPIAEDGSGAMYLVCNRGKRSITLQAHRREAAEIVEALLATADVVVANLPLETRRRMGIDWDALHERYPSTVLVTATAFGEDGPYADRIGFDGTIQAMSGAIALSGDPGAPTRCWVPYIDFTTGSLLAMGALAALARTGTHVAGPARRGLTSQDRVADEQSRNRGGPSRRRFAASPPATAAKPRARSTSWPPATATSWLR